MSEISTEAPAATVAVRKDDLDVLVAAVTNWAPGELPGHVHNAFSRLLNAFDAAHADDESGPQPAKVIVVTDENGRQHRYAAPNFGMLHDGTLLIGDKTEGDDLRVDAARAPGRWTAAHKDDVLAPDSTATALRIARNALDVIAKTVLQADDPRREVVRVARDAAEEIFTETEL